MDMRGLPDAEASMPAGIFTTMTPEAARASTSQSQRKGWRQG